MRQRNKPVGELNNSVGMAHKRNGIALHVIK